MSERKDQSLFLKRGKVLEEVINTAAPTQCLEHEIVGKLGLLRMRWTKNTLNTCPAAE